MANVIPKKRSIGRFFGVDEAAVMDNRWDEAFCVCCIARQPVVCRCRYANAKRRCIRRYTVVLLMRSLGMKRGLFLGQYA